MEKNQKKQAKQAGWFMEMLVLTAAVAVISAAVYFFHILKLYYKCTKGTANINKFLFIIRQHRKVLALPHL